LTIADIRAFILAHTRLQAVPHVPSIRLHLAEEAIALWLTLEEQLGTRDLPPPLWAFAWAGGQALARYILEHPEAVAGRHVLDLGAGSGLVGIAAMKAGAASALAADPDPFAAAALRLNAHANGVDIAIAGQDLLGAAPPRPVILAGDVFYEEPLARRVRAFLEQAPPDATILIGDPGRTHFPAGRCERLAEYRVPTSRALEDVDIKHTSVWRLLGAA
jgi:predicted nicotinamide N-methyase